MISLRYGTIPIVRQTGGLADSIAPYDAARHRKRFVFREYRPEALHEAVRQAVEAFQDAQGWRTLVARVMQQDWSWSRSAGAYAALYAEALELRGARARLFALMVAIQARPRLLEERMRTHELDGRAPHHGRAGMYDCAGAGHRLRSGAAALHPARADWRHGRLDCRRALGGGDEPAPTPRSDCRPRSPAPAPAAANETDAESSEEAA